MLPALLLAQADTPKETGNPLVSLMPLLVIGALFWFVLIRPQRRLRQQHLEMTRNIQLGDEVETIGGIFGTIRRLEDDVLWIELAPGTTVKISRGAVRRRIVPVPEPGGPAG